MNTLIIVCLVLLIPVVVIAALAFGGWIWMLCLGALAHIFAVPALATSFWNSVLVGLIVAVLFSGFTVSNRKK